MNTKSSKVGAILLATEQGLGYLARDFYRNGLIDYILIHEHTTRPNFRDWYPRESIVHSTEELLAKSDVIFGIETFFHWNIVPQAREQGKKTVMMPMYEVSNHPFPYMPDMVLCPSALDFEFYSQFYKGHDIEYGTHCQEKPSDSQADCQT